MLSGQVISVFNRTRHVYLAETAQCANTFWSRARGLLGHSGLPDGEGLVIHPCRCVHMLGMRFSIDAIYVSATGSVVAVVPNLRPGRIGPYVPQADWVLEVPAGTIGTTGTQKGDLLRLLQPAGSGR